MPDAHHFSTVIQSYVSYFPSDDNALCLIPDAHRYSAIIELYVLYFPSGRNVLSAVPNAHRRSAVVESYEPYFPSGGNVLCACETSTVAVPSLLKVTYPTLFHVAMHCVQCQTRTIAMPFSAVVEVTQLTLFSIKKWALLFFKPQCTVCSIRRPSLQCRTVPSSR